MSRMRIIVLGLAVGSAALAAYVANGFLGGPPKTETIVQNNVMTTKVLMATKDIPMGEKMSSSIAWQDWPDTSMVNGMITMTAEPDGLTKFGDARARLGIYDGEPVLEKKLVMPNDSGFMAAILPKGMRAIAVPIAVESGAGGFILPNDRVDVLLTRKMQTADPQHNVTSETVLTNVRVLALDQTFRQEGEGEKYVVANKTALLELDPKQTEIISMAGDQGKLSLTLRSIAENDGKALADTGPTLSEKYARGGQGNDLTVIRYGVSKQYTTSN
ncbi:Flp pilus assembly protein CpaB [soil metagenome]